MGLVAAAGGVAPDPESVEDSGPTQQSQAAVT